MERLTIRTFPWRSLVAVRLFSSPASSPEIYKGVTATTPRFPAERKADKRPLYRQLSALSRTKDGSVHTIMNNWDAQGNPVEAVQLMKLVKELRKYRKYKHALELVDWMVKVKGMNIPYSNHAVIIDLVHKVKGIEFAENYFANLPDSAKIAQTYGALFSCYCAEKMVDKVTSLYESMKELNFASDTLLHNNLMSFCLKLQQPKKMLTVLQYMKENNIVPDTVTCSILMNGYAAMDDIDSVERIAREMEEDKRFIVHWSAYSNLASIYISVNDFVKAKKALCKLEGLVFDEIDRKPFHFLISLHASARNLEGVERVWKMLKQKFTKLTNTCYYKKLHALDKLNEKEGLKECYEEWESVYDYYDVRLTNVVISCYLRNDMNEEAEMLYTRTKRKIENPDFRTCDLFLDYHLKKNDMNVALQWLEVASDMVQNSEWKLDKEKISLFLKYFDREKDLIGLEKFCEMTKKLSCLEPNDFEMVKWVKEQEILCRYKP